MKCTFHTNNCKQPINCIAEFILTCLFVFQSDAGWEEYYDYIFPDETAAQPNLKLLAMAKKWKEQQASVQEEEDSDTENMDEQ